MAFIHISPQAWPGEYGFTVRCGDFGELKYCKGMEERKCDKLGRELLFLKSTKRTLEVEDAQAHLKGTV